jgi:malonate transporter and related proteins
MAHVIDGYVVILLQMLAGVVVGTSGVLGEGADGVLNRLAFSVLAPCLLYTVTFRADLRSILSSAALVAVLSAGISMATVVVTARLWLRRPVRTATIPALAAGYTNASYIGIPVATYVLGNAAAVLPVLMLQLLVITPLALLTLDLRRHEGGSRGRLLVPLRNPLVIAILAGVVTSRLGWSPPAVVLTGLGEVGHAAVPVILIAFGIALKHQRVLSPGSGRREVLLAVVVKVLLMPAVALVVARYALGLGGPEVLTVVVLAALPTAQNVFNYADRYGADVVLARDAVLVTTLASLPVLLLLSVVLA